MQLQTGSDKWDEVWSVTKTAPVDSNSRFFPIAPFETSIFLTTPFCLVSVYSSVSRPTWKVAGYCTQLIQPGLTLYGSSDAETTSKILKFGLNIFNFSDYDCDYGLGFTVKPWIQELTVTVYEYTGIVTNTYDAILNEIKAAVTTP